MRLCCIGASRGACERSLAAASDHLSELIERGGDAKPIGDRVDSEFVVAAAKVLHERVAADHDRRRPVAFEPAHRSKTRLQSAVITLDAIVGASRSVMDGLAEHILDRTDQRAGFVSGHLFGASVFTQRPIEESASSRPIATARHEHVDHWPCWSTAR